MNSLCLLTHLSPPSLPFSLLRPKQLPFCFSAFQANSYLRFFQYWFSFFRKALPLDFLMDSSLLVLRSLFECYFFSETFPDQTTHTNTTLLHTHTHTPPPTLLDFFLALFFLYSPYHHLIFYLLILLIFFLVIKYKFQEFFCLVCCYISKTFPGIELALKKLVEWLMNHWMKFFLKSISL